MLPIYKLVLEIKASTLCLPKECFYLLLEVLTPVAAKGNCATFLHESKEASGNSQLDRVLSLFRESTLSISVKLLIVAGD